MSDVSSRAHESTVALGRVIALDTGRAGPGRVSSRGRRLATANAAARR